MAAVMMPAIRRIANGPVSKGCAIESLFLGQVRRQGVAPVALREPEPGKPLACQSGVRWTRDRIGRHVACYRSADDTRKFKDGIGEFEPGASAGVGGVVDSGRRSNAQQLERQLGSVVSVGGGHDDRII